jgi:hypothetical protein
MPCTEEGGGTRVQSSRLVKILMSLRITVAVFTARSMGSDSPPNILRQSINFYYIRLSLGRSVLWVATPAVWAQKVLAAWRDGRWRKTHTTALWLAAIGIGDYSVHPHPRLQYSSNHAPSAIALCLWCMSAEENVFELLGRSCKPSSSTIRTSTMA